MSNILVALDATIGLTTLATRLMESATAMQMLVQTAQSEGRDLTEAEINQIQATRRIAMDRLRDLMPPGQ